MAKKVVENKVKVKTPFVKKVETVKIVVPNGNLKIGDETPTKPLTIEVEGKVGMSELNPNQPLKIFENGTVGIGDSPSDILDVVGTFLPIGEPIVESNPNEVLEKELSIISETDLTEVSNEQVEEKISELSEDVSNILIFEIINTIQTIDRGKLDLVKELISNNQNLEAISLLKSIQTAEHGKVQDVIQRIGA